MGFVKVKAGVFNPASPDRVVEVDGVVDAGAIYTVRRRDILEGLGIRPAKRRMFKAFGGYVERDAGEAGLILVGEGVVPAIFGEAEDAAAIGATALEIFGLEVDPVRGDAQGGRAVVAPTSRPLGLTQLLFSKST